MAQKTWQLHSFSNFIKEEEDNKQYVSGMPDASTPSVDPLPQVDPLTPPATPETPATNTTSAPATPDVPTSDRGVDAQTIISQLKSLVDITSDKLSIGAPSDVNGHGTSYGNIEKAIQKLEDHVHYYTKKGEDVKFYCWNLGWNDYTSGSAVEKKFKQAGVKYEKFKFIDLGTLVKYFQANPDDAGLLKSVSLSLESNGSKAHADSMSSGEQGSLD